MDTWLKRILSIVQIICMPIGAFLGIYGAFFKKVPVEVVSRNKSIGGDIITKIRWIQQTDYVLVGVGIIIFLIGVYFIWKKIAKRVA